LTSRAGSIVAFVDWITDPIGWTPADVLLAVARVHRLNG
jgi:hypothetical protein